MVIEYNQRLCHYLSTDLVQVGLLLYLGRDVYENIIPSCTQLYTCLVCVPIWNIIGTQLVQHRYFTHESFRVGWGTSFVFGVIGTLTNQHGILWWASKHNQHHRYIGTKQDPHSWEHTSFLYAWIGWVYYEVDTKWNFVSKTFQKRTDLRVLNKLHGVIVILFLLVCWYLWGISNTIWYYWVPTYLNKVCSLLSNNFFHYPYPASYIFDTIVNIPGSMLGEYDHRDGHHAHPNRLKAYGIDPVYYLFISPLIYMGYISHTPVKHIIRFDSI